MYVHVCVCTCYVMLFTVFVYCVLSVQSTNSLCVGTF